MTDQPTPAGRPPRSIRFGAMAPRVLVPVAVVAAMGSYPTWRRAGAGGLVAMGVAGGIVLVIMFASAAAVVAGGRDLRNAAMIHVLLGLIRPVFALGAAGVLCAASPLPAAALLIWTLVFYLATLYGEMTWLVRAMRPPKDQPATGAE